MNYAYQKLMYETSLIIIKNILLIFYDGRCYVNFPDELLWLNSTLTMWHTKTNHLWVLVYNDFTAFTSHIIYELAKRRTPGIFCLIYAIPIVTYEISAFRFISFVTRKIWNKNDKIFFWTQNLHYGDERRWI